MATCGVCYETVTTTTTLLLSCHQCSLCDHCQVELTTNPTKLTCPHDIIMVTLPAQPASATTTAKTTALTPQEVSNFLQLVSIGQTKLTTMIAALTTVLQQPRQIMPLGRIVSRLRSQLDHLPLDLARQRAAVLQQELIAHHQAAVKAIDLELATLSQLQQAQTSLLSCNHLTKSHRKYYAEQLQPALKRALQQANSVKTRPQYDLVVYQEASPVALDKVGQVLPLYDSNTKTGVRFQQVFTRPDIEVWLNGQGAGRWQTMLAEKHFCDVYYHDDYAITRLEYLLWGPQQIWILHDFSAGVSQATNPANTASWADKQQQARKNYYYASGLIAGPCLYSYTVINAKKAGWAYCNNSPDDNLIVIRANYLSHRFKSGFYHNGSMIEAMPD